MESFLLKRFEGEMVSVLSHPDAAAHRSITINSLELLDFDAEMYHSLSNHPSETLPELDECLKTTLQQLYSNHPHRETMTPKQNVHLRFSNLFLCPETSRDTIPKSCDIGKFLSISGTVIRTAPVKVLESEKEFVCAKCQSRLVVEADFEQFYTTPQPTSCSSVECGSVKFTLAKDGASSSRFRDYQEIKIQEQVQKLDIGKMPRALWVVLEDDLVDCCKAGDDVTVNGIVKRRWKPISTDVQCDLELALLANHIQVNNELKSSVAITDELKSEFKSFWEMHKDAPLTGRNIIISQFCPQVFGLYVVKLSVCLALIGGVEHVDASGTRVRGESHLLLVGDPGTGKSQFLKFASRLMPRSVLTTGIGSTSAGLTVAAVKDKGEWHLEAGALVLSDGGLCCIDEFNSIREHDRGCIHEAMEQQTISVAKAGMVCKLDTKCTILAASNPKGRYDPQESLSVNLALASPLLSRFDMVLVLLDTQNKDWDRLISSFILTTGARASAAAAAAAGVGGGGGGGGSDGHWKMEKLRAYFCFVKSLKPTMSEVANRVLSRYYQLQRRADMRSAARTTIRLLESLVRLAQAHAKLLGRGEVTLVDAVVAVTLVECSMQSSALLGGVSVLHSAFPANAEQEYTEQERLVLTKLDLQELICDTSCLGQL